MSDSLLIPIAILYLLVVGCLFVYGVNFFYMTYLSIRLKPPLPPDLPEEWPRVTVQLPVFNELYVAERLIEAAAGLEYPRERLEIQVLDDSTDETVELVARSVEAARARGIQIMHVHRDNRKGFKAGALAEGLQTATGEYIAIFDADFIPPPDFLRRTVPFLLHDANLAFVQGRWGHVNRDYSFLTALQALSIDAHFMIEQSARFMGGFWFNFNGTAGIWRRKAIDDAGGWKADTLTEDLDLSYRAFLKGWRAHFLRDLEVPAELPVSFSAFRRQQHRWAKGSLECVTKLTPAVWEAPIGLPKKIGATLHLAGYGVHLLLFALALLYPLILSISQKYTHLITLFGIAVIFNVTALAPTIFFISAQHQLGRPWWRKLPSILFITTLGTGMMLNTVRAFVQILTGQATVFERTPKFGVANKTQTWITKRYQLKLDPLVYYEILFGLFNVGTIIYAILVKNYVITFYASLFAIGLFFVSGLSIAQAIAVGRNRRE
ncbi:MAG: glycosyltransferase family 2 protein [Anaerolineales bacterium]